MAAEEGLFEVTDHTEISLPTAEELEFDSYSYSDVLNLLKLKVELPTVLQQLLNKRPSWKFSFSKDGTLLALLYESGPQLDSVLEIRSSQDHFQTEVAKTTILSDSSPRFRQLQWSDSGSLLLLSRSSPVIDVIDINGGPCYSIDMVGKGWNNPFSLSHCVCAMDSRSVTDDSKWSDQLFVLTFGGLFYSYLIGRSVAGFHPNRSFDFKLSPLTANMSLTTCMCCLEKQNLIVVGGSYPIPNGVQSGDPSTAVACGLTLWREVSEEPFFSLVSTVSQEFSQFAPKKGVLSFITQKSGSVIQMAVNKKETLLASLTTEGAIGIFNLPSMSVAHWWPLTSQKQKSEPSNREDLFHSFPLSIGWWSDESIVVARTDGSVSVLRVSNLERCTGLDLNPWPLQQAIDAGILFVLDRCFFAATTENSQLEAVRDRKLWGIIPLGLISRSAKGFLRFLWRSRAKDAKRTVVDHRYKLRELRSITPKELFLKRLDAEKYDEALNLADQFGFDPDIVYQRHWLKSDITLDSISAHLKRIKDVDWILKECVTKVPNDLKTTTALLKLGLKLTEASPEPGSSSDIQAYRNHVRLLLLHFHDILNDYEEWIRCDSKANLKFDEKYFKEIRDKLLLTMAVNLARASRFTSLKHFISHHYNALVPHLLTILENIAEVCDLSDYVQIMPAVNAEGIVCIPVDNRPWRSVADWIELVGEAEQHEWDNWESFYEETSTTKEWIITDPTSISRELVAEWLSKRAQQIETLTGLPSEVEKFLSVAVERLNFKELVQLRDQYKILSVLIYEAGSQVTLTKLNTLAPLEVARLFMTNVIADDFPDRLEYRLIPYFEHVDGHAAPADLLREFMLDSCRGDLRGLFALVQSWVGGKKFSLLGRGPQLTKLVADCLWVCERPDQLDLGMKIVGLLGQESSSELDEISKQLRASEILQGYGVALTLAQLSETANDESESQKLLKRVVRKVVRQHLEESKGDIKGKSSMGMLRTVLADMLTVVKEILRKVPEHKCLEYFVEALLCSGDVNVIRSAGQFIETNRTEKVDGERRGRVPYVPAVRLVIFAANEYFNSAQNSKDSFLDLSRQCLNLIDDKPAPIAAELDLIATLPILEGMKVTNLLPVQVRLTADRTDLIRMVFAADETAYKHVESIIKLAKLLRIDGGDDKHKCRGKILTMCAGAALNRSDFKKAAEYCGEIVRLRYESGWSVCQQLGLLEQFRNREVRLELLTFALAFCEDPVALTSITESLRLLKLELISNDLQKSVKPLTDTTEVESFSRLISASLLKLKSEAKAASVQVISPTVPLFYASLKSMSSNQWEAEKTVWSSPSFRNAVGLIRAISLHQSDKHLEPPDIMVLSDALLEFALMNLSKDYALAISALLGTRDFCKIRSIIEQHPSDTTVVETILLSYAIVAAYSAEAKDLGPLPCTKIVETVWRKRMWKSFDSSDDATVLAEVDHLVTTLNSMWQKKTLTATSSAIDNQRFGEDISYQRDTILGLAMTDDQEKYEVAVKMAKEQGVSLSDVNLANLEYLLTESKLPVSLLIGLIERHKILVDVDPDALLRLLMHKIFLLIDGTSVEKLRLFYWTLQEGCAGLPEAYEAELHGDILSELMPLTPGLDYKRLASIRSDPLVCLAPYLTGDNLEKVAAAVVKLPNKAVRRQDLIGLFAGTNIRELIKTKPMSEAFSLWRPMLDQLDPIAFHIFVNESVFTKEKMRSTQRQQLLVLSLKFAEQKGWKSSTDFVLILQGESFLQWFIETEGLVFSSIKTKDPTTFDRLLGTKGNPSELVLFLEWCAIHEGLQLVQTLVDLLPSNCSVQLEPLILGLVQKLIAAIERKESCAAALKKLVAMTGQLSTLPKKLKVRVIDTIQQFAQTERCPPSVKPKLMQLQQTT